ncbi:MAG: DUF2029 domain-containing protein [Clostridia bacterium]|nr:DUF2029 domain-containing protein [Clostridia bacterium]
MINTYLQKISAWFGNDISDTSAPLLPPDGKIKFNSSNKKIFNTFFTAITVGTVIAMIAIILYYVYAFASLYNGSTKFDWLLGIFSDFVVIMNYSLEESPYVVGDSSYPPIAIAILYPFAMICKDVFAQFEFSEMTADELTAEVILYPQFWIAILLFFAVCSLLIILLTSHLFGVKGKDRLKLGVIIMFSAPFIYTVMRGNTIYFALIFLVAFLILKDSKNPVARERSYIFLALAGAIKIYPLFFGVFLLKDKKIFASFRVAVSFALIFGLSFVFFRNDFGDVSPFIDNLGGFMSNELRLLATNNLSISAQLYKLLHLFVPRLSAESTVFSVINLAVIFVVFALSTYAAIATRSNFSRYAICFAIVVLIPSISYFYVIIFSILAFLEYIRVYGDMNIKKRIFYFIAFLFLFTSFVVIAKNFILHSLIIMAILAIEIISVIKERQQIRASRKAA